MIPPDDARDHRLRQGGLRPRDPREAATTRRSKDGSIVLVGAEVDEAYIAAVVERVGQPGPRPLDRLHADARRRRDLGRRRARSTAGFDRVNILASQRTPDGDFPNVPGHVSNPEIPKTLDASIAEAKATGADLVLASDPDADRIGVGLPVTGDPEGRLDDARRQPDRRPARRVRDEADQGRSAGSGPTTTSSRPWSRPRWPAPWPSARGSGSRTTCSSASSGSPSGSTRSGRAGFLFGFEESHGYLKGTHVRDKDAAVASLLFAELAATVKDRKQTVLEYLDDLYIDVGHYGERLINKTSKGARASRRSRS